MPLIVLQTDPADALAVPRELYRGDSPERAVRAIVRRLDPSLLLRIADAINEQTTRARAAEITGRAGEPGFEAGGEG